MIYATPLFELCKFNINPLIAPKITLETNSFVLLVSSPPYP